MDSLITNLFMGTKGLKHKYTCFLRTPEGKTEIQKKVTSIIKDYFDPIYAHKFENQDKWMIWKD